MMPTPHSLGEERPVLLCLHGIGGSARSFAAQRIGLKRIANVVAWDAPGYAETPPPSIYPGPDGYVDAIAESLAELGSSRAILLGMSWGGVLAMETAIRRPDLVSALILGDSTRGSGQNPEQASAMRARIGELARDGASVYAANRVPRLLSWAAPPELRDRIIAESAATLRLAGFEHAATYMAETDLGPVLGKITAPALILYGEHDVVTGLPEARALASGIPDARLHTVMRAGHLANQEQPCDFNAAVRSFVRGLTNTNHA